MTVVPPALPGTAQNKRLKESHEVTRLLLGKADIRVVQTRRLLPGRPASRLLRFARNDSVSACHCEEYSDEAISVKVRTGGNHLSGLHH